MSVKQTCERLWESLKEVAEHEADLRRTGQFTAYDRMGQDDFLDGLLLEETANEKQHRRLAPNDWVAPFSARTGALVVLLSHVATGAKLKSEPGCALFFVSRRSAAYAQGIGYLLREALPSSWVNSASALDYSLLMAVSGGSHVLRGKGE